MCQWTTTSTVALIAPSMARKSKIHFLASPSIFYAAGAGTSPLPHSRPIGQRDTTEEVFHPLGFPIEKTLIIRRDVAMLQLLTSWKTIMDHPPKNYFHLTWSFNNPKCFPVLRFCCLIE
jgi:hypothetical protein